MSSKLGPKEAQNKRLAQINAKRRKRPPQRVKADSGTGQPKTARKRLAGAPQGDRKAYMRWYMKNVRRPKERDELKALRKLAQKALDSLR